jgi:hypothetical protein
MEGSAAHGIRALHSLHRSAPQQTRGECAQQRREHVENVVLGLDEEAARLDGPLVVAKELLQLQPPLSQSGSLRYSECCAPSPFSAVGPSHSHRTAPHRTAPHRTAPHRTAPHRTAPHRNSTCAVVAGVSGSSFNSTLVRCQPSGMSRCQVRDGIQRTAETDGIDGAIL